MKTTKFDAADYLASPEMIADYLNEALATGDTAFVTKAIGTIARAKGMTAMAREHLYKALSETGHPEFATVMKALNAIGIQLEAKAA